MWDPLLVTGLVQQDVPATWSQLVAALRPMTTVVSAVVLGGHWVLLVWRIDTVGARLHTLAVTVEYEPVLESLSRVIELYRGGARVSGKLMGLDLRPVVTVVLWLWDLFVICCGGGLWLMTNPLCNGFLSR